MWMAQVSALSDVRDCIAIDYEPGRLDVFGLVHDLGHGQADLVGHSWGGHEVLAVWWHQPSVVRTIALFGVMFSADARRRPTLPRGNAPALPVPIEAQEEVVRSISVPFLVATGAEDRNTPSALCRKLAETNRAARWLEIPGAGHMSPLERPTEATDALRSLW